MYLRAPRCIQPKISSMGLIMVLLLLFIMSGSTAFLINIANLNLRSSQQIIQGSRGNYAVLAAIEWGLVYLIAQRVCFAPKDINLNQAGIKNFRANISCTDNIDTFLLRSQAIYGDLGNLSYINKELEVSYLKKYLCGGYLLTINATKVCTDCPQYASCDGSNFTCNSGFTQNADNCTCDGIITGDTNDAICTTNQAQT